MSIDRTIPSCLVLQTSIGWNFNILSEGQPIKYKVKIKTLKNMFLQKKRNSFEIPPIVS